MLELPSVGSGQVRTPHFTLCNLEASYLRRVEGVDPASFSWDVYSRPLPNTVTLRKARSRTTEQHRSLLALCAKVLCLRLLCECICEGICSQRAFAGCLRNLRCLGCKHLLARRSVVRYISKLWAPCSMLRRIAKGRPAFWSFILALFCFSAGKKERSDAYVERKQDPKPPNRSVGLQTLSPDRSVGLQHPKALQRVLHCNTLKP